VIFLLVYLGDMGADLRACSYLRTSDSLYAMYSHIHTQRFILLNTIAIVNSDVSAI